MYKTQTIIMPKRCDNLKQWNELLCGAKKVDYRCADCTRPIKYIGYCDKCVIKINTDK
tara:strand:- start:2132 stop:2305 length:174 start_codon:yes stop_codon:yes gene_type:complete